MNFPMKPLGVFSIKFLLLLVLGFASNSARSSEISTEDIPKGVAFSIELLGAKKYELLATADSRIVFVLRFSNTTDTPLRVGIDDRNPRSGRLPYPSRCSATFFGDTGEMHPLLKTNGGSWSQYLCWSTLFPPPAQLLEYRVIAPRKALDYEVNLSDVLLVPAGGSPTGWPVDNRGKFRPGTYRVWLSYGTIKSEIYTLRIAE